MSCPNVASEQYVFCSLHDGLHHISVPLCPECSEREQPPETVDVYDTFDEVACQGMDEPGWDRCACHPEADR